MGVLTRKLWRNIISTRGQFLAVTAVVAIGIALYIAMTTAYANLERAQQDFYRQDNFADYYFQAVRAPEEIVNQISALPGVTAATGRIQQDVPVIKDDGSRADARLTSFPLPMDNAVNLLTVLSGRLFEKYPQGGRVEVLLDPQYAAANHLAPGDTVNIVAGGKEVPLTVVGTATSPEFVYPMKDAASLIPEPKDFGVFMIPTNQAQDLLGLSGQINQVVVRLAPGTDQEQIAAQIESILEPYGNLASYPRKQQLSHAVLQGKIDGIKTMSTFLPVIFLGIAALVQFVMIGRMINAQRTQIGVMKALGYGDLQIMLHYAGYALLMGVLGAGIGTGLGILFAVRHLQPVCPVFQLAAGDRGLQRHRYHQRVYPEHSSGRRRRAVGGPGGGRRQAGGVSPCGAPQGGRQDRPGSLAVAVAQVGHHLEDDPAHHQPQPGTLGSHPAGGRFCRGHDRGLPLYRGHHRLHVFAVFQPGSEL